MGYAGTTAKIPFDLTGFTYGRDSKLTFPTALVDPTRNVNYHEKGIGKRGGTTKFLTSEITGNPSIRGLFDFRARSGNQYLLFADSTGKVYNNVEANVIKTGMSANNRFYFSVFDNEVYIADGASNPQVWAEGAVSSSDISGIATDWATLGYPFQIIPHARGANGRMWYITSYAVFASANNDGDDASDSNVKKIPVYADEPLVAGAEFGGNLWVFTKSKTYLIDDEVLDTSYWGYRQAQWEGGVANWRLVVRAQNNLYFMSEEGVIYSLKAVQQTGDYEMVQLTRPAHIDRYFQEKVNLSNMENFHAVYNRTLRCIDWFVQVGGNNTNTSIRQFLDRPLEIAWALQSNSVNPSGYQASMSTERRVDVGEYTIYTGDFNGMVWSLEQENNNDEDLSYTAEIRTKPMDFDGPEVKKHFKEGKLRVSSQSNSTITVRVWVDGTRKDDVTISIVGSGALVDAALVGVAVVAEESIEDKEFMLNYYGKDLQLSFLNETVDEDFFFTFLTIKYKPLAIE